MLKLPNMITNELKYYLIIYVQFKSQSDFRAINFNSEFFNRFNLDLHPLTQKLFPFYYWYLINTFIFWWPQ